MSDLQSKDIVNTRDGKNIGKIVDLIVSESGEIEYLVVEPIKFLKKYSNFGVENKISFSQIVKFGSDVILVEL